MRRVDAAAAEHDLSRGVDEGRLPVPHVLTPVARRPSKRIRQASAPVTTVRFGRSSAGRRKALAVVQRSPPFWVTW